MKYTTLFRRIALSFGILATFSFSAIADFTPQSPAFPHGNGIDREVGACTEADPSCSTGLDFPSFNNFTDSCGVGSSCYTSWNGNVEGIDDERRFFVIKNTGSDAANPDHSAPFTNTINADVGDFVFGRIYIHNNAHKDVDGSEYTDGFANNTMVGVSGFSGTGDQFYYSQSGTSIPVNFFISSADATPNQVTDDITVTSASGDPIKLRFYASDYAINGYDSGGNPSLQINGMTPNYDSFINGTGTNIGTVKGCSAASFYMNVWFKVVEEVTTPEYDLSLEKTVADGVVDWTVAGNTESITEKQVQSTNGSFVTYRLRYQNSPTSNDTPLKTRIYDDYDETKIEVRQEWLPNSCQDLGGIIGCDVLDLAPDEFHNVVYYAKVRDGITGPINNTAEIVPDDDLDPNNNGGTLFTDNNCSEAGSRNTNVNDLDTDDCNDVSDAQVTLTPIPVDGVCGDAHTTFPVGTTAWPNGTTFCDAGTAVPASPTFPSAGQTTTWDCQGSNGGSTAACSATVAEPQTYDLDIKKYVGGSDATANEDSLLIANINDTISYKIVYRNLSSSTAIPSGTKIYDDYDETKITITSIPSYCTDNGDILTCSVNDLNIGGTDEFYFRATIKPEAAGTTFDNIAEIVPDNNTSMNDNTGGKFTTSTCSDTADMNTNTNDEDTNDCNDIDNAKVQVPATEVNGVCGDAHTTYPAGTNTYPNGAVFCSTGTAVPTSPAFPTVGNPVSWTCEGANGGTNVACSAALAAPQTYDLRITKMVEDDLTSSDTQINSMVGKTITYTLEYENLSSSTATPTGTKVYDDYDETKITITGLPSSCTDDGDILSCDGIDLAPGAKAQLTFTATINASAAGTTIDNIAEVVPDTDLNINNNTGGKFTSNTCSNAADMNTNANDDDTNDCNDIDNARIIVGSNAQPDVTIRKSVDDVDKVVSPGQTLTYTLEYENLTPGTIATGVSIIDLIDLDNLDEDTFTMIQAPDGVTCTITSDPDPLVYVLFGKYIKCTGLDDLPYNILGTIKYSIKVKNDVADGTVIENTAKISAENEDPTKLDNNESTVQVTVKKEDDIDVTITKSVDPTKTTAGSTVTYTLEFENLTTGTTATGTTIKDLIDTVHIDADSIEFSGGSNCSVTQDPDPLVAVIQGRFIKCEIGTLAASEGKKTITYTAKVKDTVSVGTKIDNTAIISIAETETNTTNNMDEARVEVIADQNYDLSINKTVNGVKNASVARNSTVTFTLSYENLESSTADALNVTITDDYDETKLEIVETSLPTGCTNDSGMITCSLGTLVKDSGIQTLTYQAKLLSTFTAGNTVNTVEIKPSPDADTNPDNDVSSAQVTIKTTTNPTPTPTPTNTPVIITGGGSGGNGGGGCSVYSTIDLNIAKYVKVGSGAYVAASSREAAAQIEANKGSTVSYKIVVSNAGDASAYELMVKDVFTSGDGMTLSNIQTISGATYTNGMFEFVNGIPANGSREFEYTATVNAGGQGVGKNTATIESFTHSYKCPKIESKRGVGRSAVSYVKAGNNPQAGYVLDKSVDKRVVKAGEEVIYKLSIKNTGDIDMKDVVLVDRFPSEYLEPVEHLKPRLTNNRTLEFKRKFLPIGDTFTVEVKMIVREGIPKGTEIKNILTGSSQNVPINDSDEEMITVGETTVAAPTCPAGYTWKAELNTCKRTWIPRTPQSGLELPLIPLGMIFIGAALFIRRNELAQIFNR